MKKNQSHYWCVNCQLSCPLLAEIFGQTGCEGNDKPDIQDQAEGPPTPKWMKDTCSSKEERLLLQKMAVVV